MHASRIQKGICVRFTAEILIILCSLVWLAQADNKKPASPPPKAAPKAAAPKAAAPSRPAATRSAPTRTAPTASKPTTSRPAAPTATKPTRSTAKPVAPATTVRTPTTGRPTGPGPSTPQATPTTGRPTPGPGAHPGQPGRNASISGRPAPRGAQQTHLQNGSAIQRRPNGRVSDVHDARRGMDVHRGLNGSRRVSVERPDHSRIVAERGRAGYVQRPYSYHGHDFARRTYYQNGRAYDRYYRGYSYHGVYMNVYAPARYYPLGFYGWAA